MQIGLKSRRERLRAREQRAERVNRRPPDFGLRRLVLIGLMAVVGVATLGSAFHRQVLEHEFLSVEGEKRFLREREIPARRGLVMDRNGEPLAISTPMATLTANPQLLVGRDEAIRDLAQALGAEPMALAARVTDYAEAGKGFIYLKRRADPQTAEAVTRVVDDHGLGGVLEETEYRRFYPGGEMFGQVVGITNVEDLGQEGVEWLFDAHLRAEQGLRRVIQDGRGRVLEEVEQLQPPSPGGNLVLSLDRRLQFLAYRELKRAVQAHQASAGAAVLLDVQTGEILAMVNQPSFNPNAPLGPDASVRRNRALTDVFEPGSTIKPFVIAAAMEEGAIETGTAIDTSPGILKVGRNQVQDHRDYGVLDTSGVLKKSSNIGVVKISQRIPREALWRVYRGLGLGDRTEAGFPGERSGYLPASDGWSDFEYATLSFGYGLNLTALQLARAYAVLAADGVRRPVTLLKRDSVPQGERVFSPEVAAEVRIMMESVTSEEGTGKRAAVPGYRIAGKTGTAKKATERGYVDGVYQSVFAGMAPASKPRYVMVVLVDEPKGEEYYGGLVAAPVFAKVMRAALRLNNVPPDDPQRSLRLADLVEPAGSDR